MMAVMPLKVECGEGMQIAMKSKHKTSQSDTTADATEKSQRHV